MRVLFWFCERFEWTPTIKTVEEAPPAQAAAHNNAIVAFVHVEPEDVVEGSTSETKLVKNAKWLARKWNTQKIILHSFTHLGDKKAEPDLAKALLDNAAKRLERTAYTVTLTPYGYFNDLNMKAPGHPLARIYKSF